MTDTQYSSKKAAEREKVLLNLLSKALGITSSARKSDVEDPYSVLGISRNATLEEARKARQARLAEYHPDLVTKLGSKIREVAEAESKKINLAYQQIEKSKKEKMKPRSASTRVRS